MKGILLFVVCVFMFFGVGCGTVENNDQQTNEKINDASDDNTGSARFTLAWPKRLKINFQFETKDFENLKKANFFSVSLKEIDKNDNIVENGENYLLEYPVSNCSICNNFQPEIDVLPKKYKIFVSAENRNIDTKEHEILSVQKNEIGEIIDTTTSPEYIIPITIVMVNNNPEGGTMIVRW